MPRLLLWFAIVVILFPSALHAGSVEQLSLPNILIITADNLGFGDLRCYNPDSPIPTPNLNQLAKDGARLTSFYTASPTCTVSRACLLTGRIPQRHGLTKQLAGVQGNYGIGLKHSEVLLPQILKQSEVTYATGCFGKWNIGFAPGSRPTERGFDEFIGHASGNLDYFHHNYREKHDLYVGTKELHRDGEYITDVFADAAIDFIQRKTKVHQPWFCYLPFNAPHFPTAGNKRSGQPNVWQAPDWAFQACKIPADETDPQKRYRATVFALDHAIGRVLTALVQTGAADNTFLFFMSDNGAFRLNRKGLDVGSNAPLRHGGVTCWEGGLRVAAMARWPGKIQPGAVNDQPFWSPDLFVMCAAMARVRLAKHPKLDGRNALSVLTDNAPSPHKSLFFSYRSHAAVRKGDWKIVRESPADAWQLFDLPKDVREPNNTTSQNLQRVTALEQEFLTWQSSF